MLENHLEALNTQIAKRNEYSKLLEDIPFWIDDREEHARLFDQSTYNGEPGFCCFTHSVGLPLKPGFGKLPWFDYQIQFNHAKLTHKYLRVIKATGLGFSEVELYFIAYLAFTNSNRRKPCQIPILTGPRIDIAMQLIDRLYNIITQRLPQLSEVVEKTNTRIRVNNATIEAFPSHHIDAVRALPNPIYILLDEADFFPYEYDDPNNPIRVVERYIPKSDPWIVLVSTPNLPGGLYERLDSDPNNRYLTFRFNYEWGLNKIYDPAQIEEAKKSPSFEREYNLKYGYNIGNVYNESWIGTALLKGERLRYIPVAYSTSKSMGIDPAYGSSKFGITKIEYLKYTQDEQYNSTKRVYFSKGYERQRYEDMVDLCYKFIKEDNIRFIFVDGSQVEFIKSLKSRIGENSDYEEIVKRAKKYNTPLTDYMNIVPILNQEYGEKLIQDAKYWLGQSKTVAIYEPECRELISQMRIAKQKDDGKLDKTPSVTKITGTLDELESFHYALQYFVHS